LSRHLSQLYQQPCQLLAGLLPAQRRHRKAGAALNHAAPSPGNAGGTGPSGFRQGGALAASLGLTITLPVLLLVFPCHGERPAGRQEGEPETARLVGARTIAVQAESLLAKKLTTAVVALEKISAPIVTVTGSIVARQAPGKDGTETRWDFSTPEV